MKTSITVEELETLLEVETPLVIYDVRKRPAFDEDNSIIAVPNTWTRRKKYVGEKSAEGQTDRLL
ncbi:MAG: hypothetical protein VW268_00540 [Rhodospirillaceae bacterium]